MFLIAVCGLVVEFLSDQLGNAEEVVHLLQTHALCLRDEEPREDAHAEAEGAEEEVGAVAAFAHGGEHGGYAAGDDEVEEPLRC